MSITIPTPFTTDFSLAQIKRKSSQYFDYIQSWILFITIISAVLVTIGTLLIGVLLNIPTMYFLTGLAVVVLVLISFIFYKKTASPLKHLTQTKQENIELKSFSTIPNMANISGKCWPQKPNEPARLPDLRSVTNK